MTTMMKIDVFENRDCKFSGEFDGPVELGRQDYGERGPFNRHFNEQRKQWRLIIASGAENAVGRHHALLEPLDGGKVKLTNGTAQTPIRFQDREDLQGKASCELKLPVVAMLGTKTIRVQAVQQAPAQLQSLRDQPRPPRPGGVDASVKLPTLLSKSIPGFDYKELVEWLHRVMDVLQAAASSDDFFMQAARTVVEMVELDSARVLLYNNGEWETQAVHAAPRLGGGQPRDPSTRVLNKMLQDKKTFWEVPKVEGGGAQVSLMGVEAVVAAPVLNGEGEVIGAVYGDRRAGMVPGMASPISELEAMLVELLARGVAAGLSRVIQEKKAAEARVQFEQFFTKDLADRLARQPDWLEGRKTEITVMFTDIRGFSRISEKLDADQVVKWSKAVLDMLSECVLAEGGVLVDYVGDGLMALWGAPDKQEDHAERACRAALTILSRLPKLNAEWRTVLGKDMEIGIGINTGMATVGNVGSEFKFKYGARGNMVNLGSRVEGVTKQFKCQVLITKATKDKLSESFRTRRLGSVRVVNIELPVEMHELVAPDREGWPAMAEDYDKALKAFEIKEYTQAARILASRRAQDSKDGPVMILLYRAVRYLVEETPPEHPVWVLEKK